MNVNNAKSEFQFVGNRILKLTLANDFVEFPDINELNCTIDAEYEVTETFTNEKSRFGLVVLWVKVVAKSVRKEKMAINLGIEGCFTDRLDADEEEFFSMLGINGSATLYSIARAQIISLSSQAMNGGQLIIPMLNFFKMKEQKEKK